MNTTTTILALAAGTTVLLAACGSATSTTPVAPLAAPQVAASPAASGPAPSSSAAGPRPEPVADAGANVDADDQSGDGTTVVVREARLAGGPGWVVIRTDDDRDDRVLGVAAVSPGRTGPVDVTLSEPVPATADDLTAVLHLDDGDGVFDESRDPAVLDDDDGRDDDGRDGDGRDGDDVEDDDFDYRVA